MNVTPPPGPYELSRSHCTAVKENGPVVSDVKVRSPRISQVLNTRRDLDSNSQSQPMEESDEQGLEPVVPTFHQLDPPHLVALDGKIQHIEWKALRQHTPDPEQFQDSPYYEVKYILETQRVRDSINTLVAAQARHSCNGLQ